MSPAVSQQLRFQKGNEGCDLRWWLLYVLCRHGKLLTVGLLALRSQAAGQTSPSFAMPVVKQDLCLEVVLPVAMLFNSAPAVYKDTRLIFGDKRTSHVCWKSHTMAPLTLSHSHNEPARASDVHGVANCSIQVCKCPDLLHSQRLELNEPVLGATLR